MGFEPTILRDLVEYSNHVHWAIEDGVCGEQGSIFGSWLEPHRGATRSSDD